MIDERAYMEEILAAIEKWLPDVAKVSRIAGTGTIYISDVIRIATHEPNLGRCGYSYFSTTHPVWVRDACGKWLLDGFGVVERLLYLREDYEEGNFEKLPERVGEFLIENCYVPEELQDAFHAGAERRAEEHMRRQLALAKRRKEEEEMKLTEQARKRTAMTAIEANRDDVLAAYEEWKEKDSGIYAGTKNKNTRKKKRAKARKEFEEKVCKICGCYVYVGDVKNFFFNL